jgi:hypothetical protein
MGNQVMSRSRQNLFIELHHELGLAGPEEPCGPEAPASGLDENAEWAILL